jgi:hypothetical protein
VHDELRVTKAGQVPEQGVGPETRRPSAALRKAADAAWQNKGRIGCGVVVAFLGYLVLRGCVPALSSSHLPPKVESAVSEAYAHCDQDFPIWPGDVRMPTCDLVGTRLVGAGTVPSEAKDLDITRAICYQVEVERMFWGESGSWKHEMAWSIRTVSKVAVLQKGTWVLFPDEEETDAGRWVKYACPGPYESSSRPVPRRS